MRRDSDRVHEYRPEIPGEQAVVPLKQKPLQTGQEQPGEGRKLRVYLYCFPVRLESILLCRSHYKYTTTEPIGRESVKPNCNPKIKVGFEAQTQDTTAVF